MTDSNKIIKLLEEKKITKKEIYDFLDMSKTGFDQAMKNNSFKFKTIIKLANYLEMPVSYFIPDEMRQNLSHEPLEPYFNKEELIRCKDENLKLLKENSKLKDHIIQLQEELSAYKLKDISSRHI